MARLFHSLFAAVLLTTFLLVACVSPKNHPNPTPPASSPFPGGPASCSAGQQWCQGSCTDTVRFTNDDLNCGRCGNQCGMGESCTAGSCSCAAGYERCMGRCVNSASFMSDSTNCGRCGNFCSAGESCFGGMCRKL